MSECFQVPCGLTRVLKKTAMTSHLPTYLHAVCRLPARSQQRSGAQGVGLHRDAINCSSVLVVRP